MAWNHVLDETTLFQDNNLKEPKKEESTNNVRLQYWNFDRGEHYQRLSLNFYILKFMIDLKLDPKFGIEIEIDISPLYCHIHNNQQNILQQPFTHRVTSVP